MSLHLGHRYDLLFYIERMDDEYMTFVNERRSEEMTTKQNKEVDAHFNDKPKRPKPQ